MNILDGIKQLINWFKGSADNQPGGASSKKLSAFWALVCIASPLIATWTVWAAIKGDWTYLPHIVDALLLFSATCLGVNAWEKKNKVANLGQDEKTQQ